jgi:hypothetical protein
MKREIQIMEAVSQESTHPYSQFRKQVRPALRSKLEEFVLCNCDRVTEDELWDFLTKKKWKKVKEEIMLYEIIQDILAVKVSDFFSYSRIDLLKSSDFSLDNFAEMQELLK